MKYVRISIFCAFLLLSLYAAYLSREDIMRLFVNNKPCASVIEYSIGKFDERFKISEADFVAELKKAEKVWEDAAGKELFGYTDEVGRDTLIINLMYDYRQQTTNELAQTGGTIQSNKVEYDKAKASYDALVASYNIQKQNLDKDITSYDMAKKEYAEQVDYWNDRDGAPADEYRELEEERRALNRKADSITAKQRSLSNLANEINKSADELNEASKKINMFVEDYNQTVNATGEEFNEGEFVQDKGGRRINVYQFDNKNVLQRLLIHEFGHAIGLDHVEDEDAIMYRLNHSKNSTLTNADLSELVKACGV
jgi:hypothetical protein